MAFDGDLQVLCDLAVDVAKKAGELLMQRPAVFDLSEKSSVLDFATQMDLQSEALIVKSLLDVRPNDGIVGEEGASRESKSGLTWVIDPIDGTVNYFYGLPGWNISIGVKDETGVIAGAVFSPTTNSLWWATRGGGAFYNGHKISCNEPVTLDNALIASGFGYDRPARISQSADIAKLLPIIRDIRRNGAAAVDLCYVAMGAVDAYFEEGLNEWDLAAGGLIATEAGALVSDRTGGAPGKSMVLAAGPTLHRELLAALAI
ncbi:MAG: inositol monophosphatase family protein [Actinomycetes bacterium]|jgi:myo-inositol-1(or 4)-monophosphatase|nr:inositol monophosphatase family protein [Actinomycetota bacterium]